MMNMKKIIWSGMVALFICAISTQAFANPKGPHYGKPPRGPGGGGKQWQKSHSGPIDTPREQKAFGKYDKNDDNHLGPKEQKYRDLDENRDGKIQNVEKKYDATHPNEKDGPRDAQWQKSHSGEIDTPLEEKKLGEYDKNDDGSLGPKERHYMHDDLNKDGTVDDMEKKHLQNHKDGPGLGNHPKPPIRDMNGDGTIDDTDRKIMIKSDVNNPKEANWDTNDDHHVSKDEYEAAHPDTTETTE